MTVEWGNGGGVPTLSFRRWRNKMPLVLGWQQQKYTLITDEDVTLRNEMLCLANG